MRTVKDFCEICVLIKCLYSAGEKNNLKQALNVAMDLVEYTCWKTNVRAWTCLLKCLKCAKKMHGKRYGNILCITDYINTTLILTLFMFNM